MAEPTTTSTPIACTEVWGDNRAVATELSLPGLRGWVLARPYQGQDAGGDVHYVSSCGTGRIARVLLADVSGHGEEVAALGGKLRRLLQRYMNHVDPRAMALQMNRDIGELDGSGGRFVTAVVMTFFSPDGGLSLCNAGHPPPMLFRRATGRWSPIDQPDTQGQIANLPLGIIESSGYEGRDLTLHPGDVVLAYTDCLIEAYPHGTGDKGDGHMLNVAGLADMLNAIADQDAAPRSPQGWVEGLLARLAVQGYTLDDDLTAVAFECTERSGGAGWGAKLAGTWRATRMMGAALTGRGPFPWPEITWVNVLGVFRTRMGRKRA